MERRCLDRMKFLNISIMTNKVFLVGSKLQSNTCACAKPHSFKPTFSLFAKFCSLKSTLSMCWISWHCMKFSLALGYHLTNYYYCCHRFVHVERVPSMWNTQSHERRVVLHVAFPFINGYHWSKFKIYLILIWGFRFGICALSSTNQLSNATSVSLGSMVVNQMICPKICQEWERFFLKGSSPNVFRLVSWKTGENYELCFSLELKGA